VQPFRLTLKNYRCFEDTAPAVVDFRGGAVAFVGPNNSGKSSLLKFFYEMRSILTALADANILVSLAGSGTQLGSAIGVEDPTEVFCNQNSRSLTIELELPAEGETPAYRISIGTDRRAPMLWKGSVMLGDPPTRVTGSTALPVGTAFQLEDGRVVPPNLETLKRFANQVNHSLYIGPYRNAITEGSGSYYDVDIGTTFIDQWNNWKTGPTRRSNLAAQDVADNLAKIFGYTRLEINAAGGSGSRTLQVIADGKPYRLRELGAGLAQFIVVFGNALTKQPRILLIDEPELNLHPSLQIDFLLSLAAYAPDGVIFSTHSVGLARSTADFIYSFRREGGRSVVQPFEQTTDFVEFLGEMSFSSFKEVGHDTVLLVEGVTEVKAVQQLLRLFGKDHTVVTLPMGGNQFIKGGRQRELSELARLTKNVAVLVDSERNSETDLLSADREAFAADCAALGFNVHVTQRRSIENYFPDSALKRAFGPAFHSLGLYEPLKWAKPGWPKSENWRAAREMSANDLRESDLGRFFEALP
jgi:ABC-type cobalamin/Fe3+-siderophores transport system ATPase subunit